MWVYSLAGLLWVLQVEASICGKGGWVLCWGPLWRAFGGKGQGWLSSSSCWRTRCSCTRDAAYFSSIVISWRVSSLWGLAEELVAGWFWWGTCSQPITIGDLEYIVVVGFWLCWLFWCVACAVWSGKSLGSCRWVVEQHQVGGIFGSNRVSDWVNHTCRGCGSWGFCDKMAWCSLHWCSKQLPVLLHLLACFHECSKLHSVVLGIIGLWRLHSVGRVSGGVASGGGKGHGGCDCNRLAWHGSHCVDKRQHCCSLLHSSLSSVRWAL